MRVAIYYTPAAAHPLARAAANWLGRSPFAAQPRVRDTGGERVAPEPAAGPDDLVADPRRYGFHATLKAPFQLAKGRGVEELAAAMAAFCRSRAAPPLGPLALARLGHFVALIPDGPRPQLEAFAGDVVGEFDVFRAPISNAELDRRRSSGLTPAQDRHLRRWGYPYVFEEFRFHMTLTGRLAEDHGSAVIAMLHERFNGLLNSTPELESLALFVEPEPGAEFKVHTFIALGSGAGL